MDFQIPKIVHEDVDDHRGVFAIEPLDRGFGHTFGNSLRRVLLSSLEGAAVTSVKVEGTAHEFTTLPGVREDVTDIILNLKNLVARLHGESPEIEVHIAKKGPGAVTAADIEAPADLEILNPELEIANLSDKGRLEVTLTIGRGRGYARTRDGELLDRGARARRPLLQLSQTGRDRDDRRPRDEDRAGAGGDPELRQKVDRGGARDALAARSPPPRRERLRRLRVRGACDAPRPHREEARPRRGASQSALLGPHVLADRGRADSDA